MKHSRILFAVLMTLIASQVQADNWPHWRGPDGNSVAPNANPPVQFGQSENVKWKAEIPGKGSGSPVIWEDNVFVVSEP